MILMWIPPAKKKTHIMIVSKKKKKRQERKLTQTFFRFVELRLMLFFPGYLQRQCNLVWVLPKQLSFSGKVAKFGNYISFFSSSRSSVLHQRVESASASLRHHGRKLWYFFCISFSWWRHQVLITVGTTAAYLYSIVAIVIGMTDDKFDVKVFFEIGIPQSFFYFISFPLMFCALF